MWRVLLLIAVGLSPAVAVACASREACMAQGRDKQDHGDYEGARRLYARGCELGSGDACHAQGQLEHGEVTSFDLDVKACRLGSAVGCYWVGLGLESGRTQGARRIAVDRAGALERFRSACAAGHPVACSKVRLLEPPAATASPAAPAPPPPAPRPVSPPAAPARPPAPVRPMMCDELDAIIDRFRDGRRSRLENPTLAGVPCAFQMGDPATGSVYLCLFPEDRGNALLAELEACLGKAATDVIEHVEPTGRTTAYTKLAWYGAGVTFNHRDNLRNYAVSVGLPCRPNDFRPCITAVPKAPGWYRR